jgi:hypothetical protein
MDQKEREKEVFKLSSHSNRDIVDPERSPRDRSD